MRPAEKLRFSVARPLATSWSSRVSSHRRLLRMHQLEDLL